MTSQEHAVERYMRALNDPKSLVDEGEVSAIEEKLTKANSPLERLRLQSQLQDLRSPSLEGLEEEFIANVQEWAEANGVTAEAFLAEGVPADVLQRAGFKVKTRGRRKGSISSRPRAPRVSKSVIREHIPAKGLFTVAQLVAACQGTEATVRKTLLEEINAGNVIERGIDETYSGRGKAPVRYEHA